jgi:superfamily II RNA helicase
MSSLIQDLLMRERGSFDPMSAFLDAQSQRNVVLYSAQEEAILALSESCNVILNTPTGSGKSLVASFLHFRSLCGGKRTVYTSPIKALVNEKFLSLCAEFGAARVGIITGDASVNAEAPLICCTAEILSNMCLRLGADTPFQDIVMDEFHYYSDRERGMAWQVPLLTLSHARFLLMSATLGDVDFFKNELTRLNGLKTEVIQSNQRPVPIAFEWSDRPLHLKIQDLVNGGKAPVYLVQFTQRECAETAQNLLSTDFCTKDEKKKISDFLSGTEFKSPYGKDLQRILKHGIGVHHAGLLPKYRILVEKLTQRGLLKIICGTDTLGVGVNVPIRTVLFTKLCKFDGEKTALLQVRDFQQISGRAGRKGFDDQGYVVVQAPEHIIENLEAERKAQGDPKKLKKFVKRKPPEKGFVSWTQETLEKLISSHSEPLQSRFEITHAVLLQVLARPGTTDCSSLRTLIRSSHETTLAKKQHFRKSWKLFRSLLERKILELNPLRVNVDLQEDFSLNHALSLYLLDTLAHLDPAQTEYALDVLTLCESILENPESILRRQVDRLKDQKMAEMKAQGLEYEERMAELEKIEHPKPKREFIYETFNAFASSHPWIEGDNIRPKSIAREMFEGFHSFGTYIREYGLERMEGVLLRYLSETYKVLMQTVPLQARTEELESVIEYLGEVLRGTDSSLIEEWERLRDPAFKPPPSEAQNSEAARERIQALKRKQRVTILNEVFRALRELVSGGLGEAAQILGTTQALLEERARLFATEHSRLDLSPKSRAPALHELSETSPGHWLLSQTLLDAEEHNDWQLVAHARFEDNSVKPKLTLEHLGPIRS